jgi:hypothetical protein
LSKQDWLLVVACTVVFATGLSHAQTGGGSIYTCIDRNGRKLTADRPIPECLDREQRELGPTGVVRRQVGPSLTEDERAQLEAQRRKEVEDRARVAEERRKERALIARYPDKATHDAERAAAIAMVDEVTATAEKRIIELRAQRKAFDAQMEAYKSDPNKAPMALRRNIGENEENMAEQLRFLAGQDRDKRRVHQRFDAELAHLRKLWEAQRGSVAGSDTVLPTSATR